MKVIFQATVVYEIDDVESFREAESVYTACVRADSAIDGVSLVSISDIKARAITEEQ